MRNSSKNTHRALLLAALALTLTVAGWQAPTLFAYSTQAVRSVFSNAPAQIAQPETKAAAKSVVAVQQQTKEQKHARMRELVAEIARLKSQPGQQTALNSAISELNQISASMGGDLPANEGNNPGQTGGGPVAVIPPAPTGCVLATVTGANSTPTEILDENTVSSTITIAGANPYLWDLNMLTFITHSFAADMDITLTSPAGTVVTITTDNGAGNDNVFNGTLWDDQSGTPITDTIFANNVVVSFSSG
jgi:hypothetical protein